MSTGAPSDEATVSDADYRRIEAAIASDDSPGGIDTKKTHVMMLVKLESIERRLDALERGARSGAFPPDVVDAAKNALGAATDTFDDTVKRLADRGVDVNNRLRAAGSLLETATDERTLEALERLAELAAMAPQALAALTDGIDDEVVRAAARGLDVDTALRNGVAAVLYLAQRISEDDLESLGSLLRSHVLHPRAVETVGRVADALVAASKRPTGSVGPFGAIARLGNADARRATAFLLEFAKQFGAVLAHDAADHSKGGATR